ncbi:hypothetical protein AVEN_104109-1 [Araneus ventricosus]|uniref:Uncharacterized protein n=1 Tax=Araneus ventricosus TaxID=182803 RepID=A0A4Y2J8A0_ARAVE|nr:hypothetical protein AVEN_104109-1 [Araneus ventricosus]
MLLPLLFSEVSRRELNGHSYKLTKIQLSFNSPAQCVSEEEAPEKAMARGAVLSDGEIAARNPTTKPTDKGRGRMRNNRADKHRLFFFLPSFKSRVPKGVNLFFFEDSCSLPFFIGHLPRK